jgi:hypothetical protein
VSAIAGTATTPVAEAVVIATSEDIRRRASGASRAPPSRRTSPRPPLLEEAAVAMEVTFPEAVWSSAVIVMVAGCPTARDGVRLSEGCSHLVGAVCMTIA